ncbi:hypothetical protein AGOR_G00039760 [Albula goreensis]|uniref:Uncharacterized protein n=1 Tax=Albula goreensis TaxID=1534307 RepID=A0A8T3E128_9TELE|nr:hypothetical protein AGOR_G00039760 [Albula goreensis]
MFYSFLYKLLPLIMRKAVSLSPFHLHSSSLRNHPAPLSSAPSLSARWRKYCSHLRVCLVAGQSLGSCPIGCWTNHSHRVSHDALSCGSGVVSHMKSIISASSHTLGNKDIDTDTQNTILLLLREFAQSQSQEFQGAVMHFLLKRGTRSQQQSLNHIPPSSQHFFSKKANGINGEELLFPHHGQRLEDHAVHCQQLQ